MVRLRLQRRGAVANEVRRVAARQLDRALSDLQGEDPDVAVHDARRRIKELRALVKLIRPAAPHVLDRENPVLRDAGRRLSEVRDVAAKIEALDGLIAAFPNQLAEAGGPVRAGLERRRRDIDPAALDQAIADTHHDLEAIRARTGTWELPDDGFDTIAPGLRRSYRRARRRMRAVYADDTTTAFHEWRKRVKDHRYQVAYLRPSSPKLMRERERALHALTDLIGDDHDLALVRDVIEKEPHAYGGGDVVATVVDRVDQQRAWLQRDARALGGRCFDEAPRCFVDRLRADFHAHQSTRD